MPVLLIIGHLYGSAMWYPLLPAACVEKAHVYGVSLGGDIAAQFAMRYPNRVLSTTLDCTMFKSEKTKLGMRHTLYNPPLGVVRAILNRMMTPARYGSAASREAALRDIEMLKQNRFTMRGVKAQAQAISN